MLLVVIAKGWGVLFRATDLKLRQSLALASAIGVALQQALH